MTEVLVAALGTALALAGVISSIRSRPMSAGEVLEAAYAPRGSHLPSVDPTPGPREGPARGHAGSRLLPRPDVAVARRVVAHLEHRSRVPADLATWCAAAGRSLDEVAARMVLGALCGVAVAFAIVAVAIPTGWPLPAEIPVWAGAALATAGALAPLVSLRAEARDSRRAARAAVSSFLDLVTLCLAGGMGIEGALHASAGVARDPLSARLRLTLLSARHRGDTPWQALAALGRELGIDELTELSAAVGLAGTEGARIRSTLSAKAASIRRRQLSEAEAEANTITERLFLPGTFLLVGFLLFVGYPAVSRILGGF